MRYLTLTLSSLQDLVASDRQRKYWAEKLQELGPEGYRELMDRTNPDCFSPRRVSEQDALNFGAPEGYRLVSKTDRPAFSVGEGSDRFSFPNDAIYLFERVSE